MFPVPNHLPRTGGDHVASSSSTPAPMAEEALERDVVLDHLEPLLNSEMKWTGMQIKQVREKLEDAVKRNKTNGHDLLISNFPSISTHIRTGNEIQVNYNRVEKAISTLEREIDTSSPTTSFLPPLLNLLNQHHKAQEARARSKAHLETLKFLKETTSRIEKLEQAVWAGRGADDWVITELDSVQLNGSVIAATQTAKNAEAKLELFKSMVTEQVTDAFSKAVSFAAASSSNGATLSVQTRTTLQLPRIPRTLNEGETSKPSVPPPYPLTHVYVVLSKLSALSPILQSLRTRILKDLINPIMSSSASSSTGHKVVISKSDSLSILRLEPAKRTSTHILEDVSAIIDFVNTVVLPASDPPLLERTNLICDLRQSVLEAFLENVIIPSTPSTLSSVPRWLEMVQQAVIYEASASPGEDASTVIKTFYDFSAGSTWVKQRRQRIADEVRKLILSGWGGWETVSKEREEEVVIVVEVDEAEEPNEMKNSSVESMAVDEADFGWGFDDDTRELTTTNGSAKEDDAMDDGWGFKTAEAGPSKSKDVDQSTNDPTTSEPTMEENGWDFESPLAEAVSNPIPPPIAKPAREAKRLGKKVAKVKHVDQEDDDPWHVSESNFVSLGDAQASRTSVSDSLHEDWSEASSGLPVTAGNALKQGPIAFPPPDARKKVLKQVTEVVKEVYLVSRACDKLFEIAERVLREIEDLRTLPLASPSFANASSNLQSSLTDIFDIYRSLIPIHFATQIQSVPIIAFQVYNDHHYLASQLGKLKDLHPWWDASDSMDRLNVGGDRVFEDQLSIQVSALLSLLDDCGGFLDVGSDDGFRRCEKSVKGVVHDLDTLGKVLKAVLPTTTHLSVLGYLLDTAVQKISTDLLSLDDITEVESNRLNDLVKLVYPLENMFKVEDDQPSTIVAQVPHWLKFCYISELLQANLVDITYLFDTGALVDFTTDELVNIIRALFADSPKRDAAIEKIELGLRSPKI